VPCGLPDPSRAVLLSFLRLVDQESRKSASGTQARQTGRVSPTTHEPEEPAEEKTDSTIFSVRAPGFAQPASVSRCPSWAGSDRHSEPGPDPDAGLWAHLRLSSPL
jgi:hypothetical protein